jgi:hypothetical protein
MASTVLSCFLMVPIISAFNHLVAIKIEGSIIDEGKAEIKAQRAEVERLKAENRVRMLEREKMENRIAMAKQSIEIEILNDNIKLLENAQISVQSFQKILQVALLETTLKQTLVRKEPTTDMESGWGIKANYFHDEALVVITHDIIAKFGVDLNEVKLIRLDGNTVVVSGIRSKYIGSSKNISDTLLKEIRRINYKKGVVDSILVQNDRHSINDAGNRAVDYEREFQTKLSEGLELGFMNDAVVQLAQNFITVMLAPMYRNIKFDDIERPDALPLMQHLQKELEDTQGRKIELLNINDNLLLVNKQLETDVAKIETEQNIRLHEDDEQLEIESIKSNTEQNVVDNEE